MSLLPTNCTTDATYLHVHMGEEDTRWHSVLHAGRSRVRFSMVSLTIFHWLNPSGCTMALGSTQPLTEMSTSDIFWGGGGEGRRCLRLSTFMCRPSRNLACACFGIFLIAILRKQPRTQHRVMVHTAHSLFTYKFEVNMTHFICLDALHFHMSPV
jgi:hypothetical protein